MKPLYKANKMIYIQKTTETYLNIKVVTINKSSEAKPVSTRKTLVYVNNKVVTGQSRFEALNELSEANQSLVTWKDERNF